MTAHDHRTHVEGCYRCELSQDEVAPTDPRTRARQLLTNATPGEWEVWPNCDDERLAEVVAWHDGKREFCEVVMRTTSRLADAELIAAAPQLIAELCDALDTATDPELAARLAIVADWLDAVRHPDMGADVQAAARKLGGTP